MAPDDGRIGALAGQDRDRLARLSPGRAVVWVARKALHANDEAVCGGMIA